MTVGSPKSWGKEVKSSLRKTVDLYIHSPIRLHGARVSAIKIRVLLTSALVGGEWKEPLVSI
jgi:hypothetical protein